MSKVMKSKRERDARRKASKKLYGAWRNMIRRCENPACADYRFYGAKGIKVCASWEKSFANFARDVGEPPHKNAHISRRDGTKGYFKKNVVWLSPIENLKTSRSVRRVKTHAGEITMADAARQVGKDPLAVQARVRSGMAPGHAILAGKNMQRHMHGKYGQPELNLKTIKQIADEADVPYHKLHRCIASGMTIADAIHAIRAKRAAPKRETHAQIAKRLGLTKTAVTIRLRNGWTYEQATTLPKYARPV